MSDKVVVLGAGYAGAGAIKSLEDELNGEADVTWISDTDYHLVLHESHRCIRDPSVQEKIAIPIHEIKQPTTNFRQDTVVDIDTEDRLVELESGDDVEYDYLLVGLGSQTAFFGIDGLEEYAHTLKSLDDALGIHDAIQQAARDASQSDPAQVIVGGAGLSGIQTAGEIAEFRDNHRAPIDIHLVEGLDEIFPGNDPELQGALRKRLEDADVNILTGDFIGEVDEETVYIGDDEELDYDTLIWTGGITGRDCVRDVDLEKDERNHRIHSEGDFQTEDERVFAIGDCALIDQPGEQPAPPTAQAAWQAAEVAGQNLARAVRGQPLKTWTHKDKGTVISVGEEAVAHDVMGMPIDTFGGFPAKMLKKGIAARWIADVTGIGRAAKAWPDM
ncbi:MULTISPECIES: NAD(P)/FAD-dependent oxidoreductase [Haloarcula]|uniref:NADH dehydrogenase n=1 Tax=Haloarcula pellucida TaxID=1427151 RepID=A0A830GHZ8_9EURY|nr:MULTISPECIES: NAD(P)/FAD-dependent oxidoreductase [Halomicroarcula]MBX0347287.1 NAD(P)/FAD-dependent oxidoreductase [Halomicroarcula pellucida]MDS0276838.1 NAD(P)/FAD-dependent oxidoreductase [Halomicroarcula sp. S1AR25-4]GGN87939.1 NADH dehydrogenase [Halomicroarcula pellucida]